MLAITIYNLCPLETSLAMTRDAIIFASAYLTFARQLRIPSSILNRFRFVFSVLVREERNELGISD